MAGGRWRRDDDPETWAAEQDTRGLRGFEEISKISHVGLYIPTLSVWPSGTTQWHRDAESQAVTATRCDRKVKIGCTDIETLDQLSDLGVDRNGWLGHTEIHKEVLEVYVYDESGTPSAPHTEWFESDLIKLCDVAWIEFETRKAYIGREGS